jgi:hypothetical protein
MNSGVEPLDQLSTSQTSFYFCPFGAPLVALIVEGKASIRQTCCNHWECPVCGDMRARQEYRRIVFGAEELGKEHKLYFWTLTCRGRECSLKEAEENYYAWTNVLLTNARTKAQRAEMFWAYVQVTERQKKNRRHPHSHIITTFLPDDAQSTRDGAGEVVLVSKWFVAANASSGLGSQHKITEIRSSSAVSRYVAKYLFKDTSRETFPPKWKRVRYSQNYPKTPVLVPGYAKVLLKRRDWDEIAEMEETWQAKSEGVLEYARHRIGNVVL